MIDFRGVVRVFIPWGSEKLSKGRLWGFKEVLYIV